MELKEAFTRSISEVFTLFQMRPLFPQEAIELPADEDQIYVLISFAQALKGKIMFKFTKTLGEKIAASVSGVPVSSFDDAAKSALGEIMSFAAGLTLGKYMSNKDVSLLPPIFIKGNGLFAMISRVKVDNLVFQLYDGYISVIYCLE